MFDVPGSDISGVVVSEDVVNFGEHPQYIRLPKGATRNTVYNKGRYDKHTAL